MMLAAQYAKALRAAIADEPTKGHALFANLHTVLKRRGHEKLVPQIGNELKRIALAEDRIQSARTVTPERERTRVLFELYKQLTQQSSQGALK